MQIFTHTLISGLVLLNSGMAPNGSTYFFLSQMETIFFYISSHMMNDVGRNPDWWLYLSCTIFQSKCIVENITNLSSLYLGQFDFFQHISIHTEDKHQKYILQIMIRQGSLWHCHPQAQDWPSLLRICVAAPKENNNILKLPDNCMEGKWYLPLTLFLLHSIIHRLTCPYYGSTAS